MLACVLASDCAAELHKGSILRLTSGGKEHSPDFFWGVVPICMVKHTKTGTSMDPLKCQSKRLRMRYASATRISAYSISYLNLSLANQSKELSSIQELHSCWI